MDRTVLLLTIAMGVPILEAMSQVSPSIVMTPSAQQIQRDSVGLVRVRVNNIQHLHAYNVEISYDPALLRCRSVRGLGFLGSTTFFAYTVDSTNGRTTVNEAILGVSGQSGSGDLAELKFWGVGNGAGVLTFSVADFRDTVGHAINVTTQGAVIQVGPPSFVHIDKEPLSQEIRMENYPNPFNPMTTIRYVSKQPGETVVTIHSILGEELYSAKWYDASFGTREFVWNGQNRDGQFLPSGSYVVRLEAGTSSGVRKISLLR